MECVYDEYFANGQDCERNLECDDCEIRERVREILLSIHPCPVCPECGDRILKAGHCHNEYCSIRRKHERERLWKK